MAARKEAKRPKTEEEKYQTKVSNFNNYHKDRDGVSNYVDRIISLMGVYEKVRRGIKRNDKNSVLPVEYRNPPNSEAVSTAHVKDGNILFLKREITKEIKAFKKIFSWSKKRQPQRRKRTSELTVEDIGGNNSPTVLGPALVDLINTERITDAGNTQLLQALQRASGGQPSLLQQGFALSTTVTNVLFLITNSNHLQRGSEKRSDVKIDAQFERAFGGSIPAVYSYVTESKVAKGKKAKLIKVPNARGLNTFAVLAEKPRKGESKFDPRSGYIKTQNFQEIRAVNMYSNEDVKAGDANGKGILPGGDKTRAYLENPDTRARLLAELKIVAAFRESWAQDPATIEEKAAAAAAAQKKKKSPK